VKLSLYQAHTMTILYIIIVVSEPTMMVVNKNHRCRFKYDDSCSQNLHRIPICLNKFCFLLFAPIKQPMYMTFIAWFC